jgi:hypothetical protein
MDNVQNCNRYIVVPPRGTLYPQKLALTSPTSGGLSVGIVHSRTQTTEFVCFLYCCTIVTNLKNELNESSESPIFRVVCRR